MCDLCSINQSESRFIFRNMNFDLTILDLCSNCTELFIEECFKQGKEKSVYEVEHY